MLVVKIDVAPHPVVVLARTKVHVDTRAGVVEADGTEWRIGDGTQHLPVRIDEVAR